MAHQISSFPKRTSPFKSAGESVQSTAGSRGVRISVSYAGYTTFRGSVRVLATHSIRQFPLHFPSLRHRVPSGFKRALKHYSFQNEIQQAFQNTVNKLVLLRYIYISQCQVEGKIFSVHAAKTYRGSRGIAPLGTRRFRSLYPRKEPRYPLNRRLGGPQSRSGHDIVYLLTANGLTSVGNSTLYIYTQTVHRTTQSTQNNT